MKLIIRNGDNISLTESLGVAYTFIGNHGLNEIIADCKKNKDGIGTIYGRESPTNIVVYWPKLNKDSLTICVRRDYKNNE